MPFLSWVCVAAWVAAGLLQLGRIAYKFDAKRERLYRMLTVATVVAVVAGIALQAVLAFTTGGFVHARAVGLGIVILALLALIA